MTFQEHLKTLLAARGMAQVELARRLGVTHSAVTMILNDKMRLPPARLDEVLGILQVPEAERLGLRAEYLASVAPHGLKGAGAEMLQAYRVLQERADLGDALFEADTGFDELPPRNALSARQGYYGSIIDTLTTLGAFNRATRHNLRTALESAQSSADTARIVAKIAIGIVRLRPDATKTELFGKLRAVLSHTRVKEILANAQRGLAR